MHWSNSHTTQSTFSNNQQTRNIVWYVKLRQWHGPLPDSKLNFWDFCIQNDNHFLVQTHENTNLSPSHDGLKFQVRKKRKYGLSKTSRWFCPDPILK